MTEPTRIEARASELLDAARKLQTAADQPGSHAEAPEALASLEEALRALSAASYQLAADAVPRVVDRRRHRAADDAPAHRDGLSRETEVQLVSTLHDVAAAFARCARACREARTVATEVIARATPSRRVRHEPDQGARASRGDPRPAVRAA